MLLLLLYVDQKYHKHIYIHLFSRNIFQDFPEILARFCTVLFILHTCFARSSENWKPSAYPLPFLSTKYTHLCVCLSHLCRAVRSTFAVRETASLGIMGAPRVPPLNPSRDDSALRALSFLRGLRGSRTVHVGT